MKVDIIKKPALPKGANPYHHDLFHAGMGVGSDWNIMFLGKLDDLENVVITHIPSGQQFQLKINTGGD